MKKAQGTIEYLVIIAIVVVIGLVVVGLMTSMTDSGSTVSSTSSELQTKIGVGGISISDAVVDTDRNGIITLTNNSGAILSITKISFDGVDSNYNANILQGDKTYFSIPDMGNNCSCVGVSGSTKTCSVTIYANSEYGIQKVFTSTVTVNCVAQAITSNSVVVANPVVDPLPTPISHTFDYLTFNSIVRDNWFIWQAGDNGVPLIWSSGGTPTALESCESRSEQYVYPACEYCEALALCKDGNFDENGSCSGNGGVLFSGWYLPRYNIAYEDYSYYESDLAGFFKTPAFTNFTSNDYYWTATGDESSPDFAYAVDLSQNLVDKYSKDGTYSFRARCVTDEMIFLTSLPTSDGGTLCTDSNQCESFCSAPLGTVQGTPVVGSCYGYIRAYGWQEVINGIASPPYVSGG